MFAFLVFDLKIHPKMKRPKAFKTNEKIHILPVLFFVKRIFLHKFYQNKLDKHSLWYSIIFLKNLDGYFGHNKSYTRMYLPINLITWSGWPIALN